MKKSTLQLLTLFLLLIPSVSFAQPSASTQDNSAEPKTDLAVSYVVNGVDQNKLYPYPMFHLTEGDLLTFNPTSPSTDSKEQSRNTNHLITLAPIIWKNQVILSGYFTTLDNNKNIVSRTPVFKKLKTGQHVDFQSKTNKFDISAGFTVKSIQKETLTNPQLGKAIPLQISIQNNGQTLLSQNIVAKSGSPEDISQTTSDNQTYEVQLIPVLFQGEPKISGVVISFDKNHAVDQVMPFMLQDFSTSKKKSIYTKLVSSDKKQNYTIRISLTS